MSMQGGYIRTEATKLKLSETRKKRIAEGKIVVWNKGLTKKDPRVLKNTSTEECRRTQFKKGIRPDKTREGNANWKGGRIIKRSKNGLLYYMLHVPEHPNNLNGYVLEHRLVMEKHLGRYLKKGEVVHHINENPLDNRIENMVVITQSEHIRLHNLRRSSRLQND